MSAELYPWCFQLNCEPSVLLSYMDLPKPMFWLCFQFKLYTMVLPFELFSLFKFYVLVQHNISRTYISTPWCLSCLLTWHDPCNFLVMFLQIPWCILRNIVLLRHEELTTGSFILITGNSTQCCSVKCIGWEFQNIHNTLHARIHKQTPLVTHNVH